MHNGAASAKLQTNLVLDVVRINAVLAAALPPIGRLVRDLVEQLRQPNSDRMNGWFHRADRIESRLQADRVNDEESPCRSRRIAVSPSRALLVRDTPTHPTQESEAADLRHVDADSDQD